MTRLVQRERWKGRRKAKPTSAPDYRLVYQMRLKLIRGNCVGESEEPRLRAIEHAVKAYRNNNSSASFEDAKAAVLAAIDVRTTRAAP